MVDFGKLRKQQQKSTPVNPEEIFLRLPKSPEAEGSRNFMCLMPQRKRRHAHGKHR